MSSPESYFSSSQWTLLDQCLRLMSNWIGELKGQATGYSGYPCMPIRCILQISHPISITITCFYLHGCCLTCWIVVPFCFWFASFCILTYNHHHWLSHTLGGSCAKCDYFTQPTHVLVGLTCFLPIRYSLHPFHPWALSLNYNKFSFLTLPGSLVEAYYCHVYEGTVKSKDYSGATRIFGEKLCSDERFQTEQRRCCPTCWYFPNGCFTPITKCWLFCLLEMPTGAVSHIPVFEIGCL